MVDKTDLKSVGCNTRTGSTPVRGTKKLQMAKNLKSSVNIKGRYVSQILHFVGGEKRTFHNVDTHSIKQGQFTKFQTKDGRMIMVNDKNILCIEIISDNSDE